MENTIKMIKYLRKASSFIQQSTRSAQLRGLVLRSRLYMTSKQALLDYLTSSSLTHCIEKWLQWSHSTHLRKLMRSDSSCWNTCHTHTCTLFKNLPSAIWHDFFGLLLEYIRLDTVFCFPFATLIFSAFNFIGVYWFSMCVSMCVRVCVCVRGYTFVFIQSFENIMPKKGSGQ